MQGPSQVSRPRPQPGKPIDRLLQRLHFLAEREANLAPTELRVREEAAAGDDADAQVDDEVAGEGDVVVEAKAVELAHHVIRAVRWRAAEAQSLKVAHQIV